MPIIILDPGHGGSDPGAVGYGLQEKNLTLEIARKTLEALGSYQASVYLTRDYDMDVELYERADFANGLQADYFLSIHINAGGGTGFESYVYTYADAVSRGLRDVIHARMSSFYGSAGFPDRGEMSANFAVLRLTEMPSALLENLFIDTQKDALKLSDPSFLAGVAGAVAAGLAQVLSLKPAVAWDPTTEINKLKSAGLINSAHDAAEKINWGTFAAVVNRYRGKSFLSDPWNPAGEVLKLKSDGLINSGHDAAMEVLWGEFAAVLNRLRGAGSTVPWNPAAEVQKLMADGLINSVHDSASAVNWGEFATVINRIRERK